MTTPAHNDIRSNGGFTIVETLVAVTILMIAIAGPLSIASKGLSGALASRDQLIASYLAQESMEVIKNMRDNNIDLGLNWIDGTYALTSCTVNVPCDASAVDLSQIITGRAAPLYIAPGNYYSHTSSGQPSIFTRYSYLSQPESTAPCTSADEECTATVKVEWYEGAVPYNVTIASQMVNTSR